MAVRDTATVSFATIKVMQRERKESTTLKPARFESVVTLFVKFSASNYFNVITRNTVTDIVTTKSKSHNTITRIISIYPLTKHRNKLSERRLMRIYAPCQSAMFAANVYHPFSPFACQ